MIDGSGDVIARAISRTMRVPVLEEIRSMTTEEEYRTLLLLAGEVVEYASASGLDARIIGLTLAAAAAMYSEGVTAAGALMGRGPGGN